MINMPGQRPSDIAPFMGFTPDVLDALSVPGVSERWAAVQACLHPALAALAEQIRQAAQQRMPRQWELYEISFKNQRYVNRGAGERAPIEEYHVAIDRPPRGSGVYIVISAAERRLMIVLQLQAIRKAQLQQLWEQSRFIWQPLITRLPFVRFAERPTDADSTKLPMLWLDRYLAARNATTLLAGFSYRWQDERLGQADFATITIADALALLELNEAIMEQVEQHSLTIATQLRETPALYGPGTMPPIETLIERIHARGMTIANDTIRAYHLALQTRPLVIVPGISGTGKTRLTRLYADAVYNCAVGQENEHYLLVAVQPDWHNARDLFGYYNAITSLFHATPFLRFLMRAEADPLMPYYVCLDEMNLARPEYYLAPILSAIETDERLIDLGAPSAQISTVSGELLSNPMRLPRNLALIGTVNVDESTHSLSDKLLDRANVIELTDVDLEAFRESYARPIDPHIWEALTQVHGIVTRAGQPFGYRVIGEMLRYVEQAHGVLSPQRALDQQIKQKILPRLRGDDSPRLRRALTQLLTLLLGQAQTSAMRAADIASASIQQAPFPESAEKTRRMLERLDQDGFTDFY